MKPEAKKHILHIPARLIHHLNQEKIRIWDVRTPMEFVHGHIEGAENIPFDEIDAYLEKPDFDDRTIITCSADDPRSQLVSVILTSLGHNAVDGGHWETLRELVNNQLPKSK